MNNLPLAFLLGLLGSLHCAVMCGPLMLSFPTGQKASIIAVTQLVLYQLGRIVVYTLLGVLVGIVGNSITLFSSQETLSLIIGSVLIFFTILHFSGRKIKVVDRLFARLISPISNLMSKTYGRTFWGLYAGLLNGLIPCGMVYLAMASALNVGTIAGSASFMFQFGLGTTPLMLAISLGGIYLKKYLRLNTGKWMPWLMLFMGALFVLRAIALDIPFLSPSNQLHHGTAAECR